jgi:hypothetical protein
MLLTSEELKLQPRGCIRDLFKTIERGDQSLKQFLKNTAQRILLKIFATLKSAVQFSQQKHLARGVHPREIRLPSRQ